VQGLSSTLTLINLAGARRPAFKAQVAGKPKPMVIGATHPMARPGECNAITLPTGERCGFRRIGPDCKRCIHHCDCSDCKLPAHRDSRQQRAPAANANSSDGLTAAPNPSQQSASFGLQVSLSHLGGGSTQPDLQASLPPLLAFTWAQGGFSLPTLPCNDGGVAGSMQVPPLLA
jgi:hypothetical protein